ncbi:MAG: helix-turn-helix domain-containing protein [Actinophytocola sp.]|nr:helix-turn-helix domain-containing protein [Actinophytocola sp.]
MTVLLREAIGDRLRHARTNQRRTLREISHSARVSLGYLSEVERGQKEASSELLAAICDALQLPLPELLTHVATDMAALDNMVINGSELGAEPQSGAGMPAQEQPGEITNSAAGMTTALRRTISSPKVSVFAA